MKFKNYKKLICVFLSFYLSLFCLISPVECSEVNIEAQDLITQSDYITPIYDNAGIEIGFSFDEGIGYNQYNDQLAKFSTMPILRIKLMKGENEVDLDFDQNQIFRLEAYHYNLGTQTTGEFITGATNNNDLNTFDLELREPMTIKLRLKVTETSPTGEEEITYYDFEKPIVEIKSYTWENTYIEMTVNNKEKDQEAEIQSSWLYQMLYRITLPLNFLYEFFLTIVDTIINIVEVLLIPSPDFLEIWATNMQGTVEEKLPILALPTQLLTYVVQSGNGTGEYWIKDENNQTADAKLSWNAIIINDIEYFPEGEINFTEIVEQHEGFQRIKEITNLATDFIIGLYFYKFINRKINLIFGTE